jgi:hypothetical protein
MLGKSAIIEIMIKDYLGYTGKFNWLPIKKSYYLAKIKVDKKTVIILVSTDKIEIYGLKRKIDFSVKFGEI